MTDHRTAVFGDRPVPQLRPLPPLVWLGIDPVTAITPYFDRIPLAQAKDIQLFPDQRNRWGWSSTKTPVWGGTEDKAKLSLEIAHRTLRPPLVR